MSPTCKRRKENRRDTATRRRTSLDAPDDFRKDDDNGVRATVPTDYRGEA